MKSTQNHIKVEEKYLKYYQEKREILEKLELLDRLAARERYLHELCFYGGECPPARIEHELAKVRKYLQDVKYSSTGRTRLKS